MIQHPDFDPVALQLGPVAIHWYGLMYLVGFAAGAGLGVLRARRAGSGWRPAEVSDLLFFIAVGVILGGRLGYVLFYNFPYYIGRPWEVLYLWSGGMSFHGGLLGVIVAMWWFARRSGRAVLQVSDFVAPLVPPGLLAGRLGNFINQELWGRPTDLPWAVVFPRVDAQPRHPSQLYEAMLEGVVLFALLWLFSSRPRPAGAVSGLFLVLYGCFRFVVEFARQPDPQLGFLVGWLTMGQLLSVPMVLAGIGLMWWSRSRADTGAPERFS